MPNKFLTTRGGVSGNLDDGTQDIFVKSVTVANLEPSKPIKTNPTGTLIATLLNVSDVNGLQQQLANTLTNPYNGVLSVHGLITETKITNDKDVSEYNDDNEMISKKYVDLKAPQGVGQGDSPTFKNITITDSVISSLIPSQSNLYNLGSYQTIWKNIFCDYFSTNGVESKYVSFKSDLTSDRFRIDHSSGVLKATYADDDIFDITTNGIAISPFKKITNSKDAVQYTDDDELVSKAYVDRQITTDVQCTSLSVKNNANFYGLRLQSTTNLSIVENTLALGDDSNDGTQVNLISFFIRDNNKFTIGANDIDNTFFITKNTDTRLLKYYNGDGLLELNGGKVAIRANETAFQDRIVGTDLGSSSNPFDNIYVNNIISSNFDGSKTQNIIVAEPGKTVFYKQIDIYQNETTPPSSADETISMICDSSIGKLISGSGLSIFNISSNYSNLVLSASKNNNYESSCIISLEPSRYSDSKIRIGFASDIALTIEKTGIETLDIKTSQHASVNAILSKVQHIGATSIYTIPATDNPNVENISLISNFQVSMNSDDSNDVGMRLTGAFFTASKKGKFLISVKNFYNFYNTSQNNYVSQFIERNGIEYAVSSQSVVQGFSDANLISSIVLDCNVGDELFIKCYTSSQAGLNVFANGHTNPGQLTVTLLRDDNIITYSSDGSGNVTTISETVLNRLSVLESLHNSLKSEFTSFQSSDAVGELQDDVANLAKHSELQSQIITLQEKLNTLESKFHELTCG